jgi:hypothetical protein
MVSGPAATSLPPTEYMQVPSPTSILASMTAPRQLFLVRVAWDWRWARPNRSAVANGLAAPTFRDRNFLIPGGGPRHPAHAVHVPCGSYPPRAVCAFSYGSPFGPPTPTYPATRVAHSCMACAMPACSQKYTRCLQPVASRILGDGSFRSHYWESLWGPVLLSKIFFAQFFP